MFLSRTSGCGKLLMVRAHVPLFLRSDRRGSGMLVALVAKMNSTPFQLRVVSTSGEARCWRCSFSCLQLCYYIRQEVEKKFPGKGSQGVGAFVFLRMICPAIVSPETRSGVASGVCVCVCADELVKSHRKRSLLHSARFWCALRAFCSSCATWSTAAVSVVVAGIFLSSLPFLRSWFVALDAYIAEDDSPITQEQWMFVGQNLPRIKQFLENVGTKSLDGLEQPAARCASRADSCGLFDSLLAVQHLLSHTQKLEPHP